MKGRMNQQIVALPLSDDPEVIHEGVLESKAGMVVNVFLCHTRRLVSIASQQPHATNSLWLEVSLYMDTSIAIHLLGDKHVKVTGNKGDIRRARDEDQRREWDAGIYENRCASRRR